MIEARELSFAYQEGAFRLDVPSLTIDQGESVALIGPSGSGKTTLVHLLTGVLPASRGGVRLAGRDLTTMSEDARRALRIRTVGMVFQEFALLEYLTAGDNVLLPYFLSSALELDRSVRSRSRRLAHAMGVEHLLRRRPDRLSQGERQRVAICRALVTEPRLVLCDEPTGNLDPKTAHGVLDLLFEQAAERSATLLMVTHDHALLGRFDRVLDMGDLVSC